MNDLLVTVGVVQTAEDFLKVIALGGSMVICVVWMVMSAVTKSVRMNQAERTRREIAAYVAEGTISPEQGERMMRIAGSEPQEA